MRSGDSGIYISHGDDIGLDVCMLRKTQLNSWYRDPYLLALWDAAGRPEEIDDPWFLGIVPERWLKFRRKSAEVRCFESGWAVRLRSAGHGSGAAFLEIMESLGWSQTDEFEGTVRIRQREIDGRMVDAEDRIRVGRGLIGKLLEGGF